MGALPAAQAATFATSTSLPATIPDGTSNPPSFGAPTTLSFPVSGLPSGTIDDVEVTLTSTHTFVGDLEVVLSAPGGSPSQTIFSRTGAATAPANGSGANFNGPYTFADSAPAAPTWWSAAALGTSLPVPSGSYRASTPGGDPSGGANTLITPAFAGLSTTTGTWTLSVRDAASTDTGSITAASITLHTVADTTILATRLLSGAGLGDSFTYDTFLGGQRSGATGTESLDVYGPDNPACSGTPVFSTSRALDNGPFAPFTPTQQGVYRARVSYSGDAENGASSSACGAPIAVGPAFVPFDTVSGQSLDASAPATPNGRPFRGGLSSSCGLPNVPASSGAGPYPFKTFIHTNTASTPNCVRASVDATACPIALFLQSYASPFDPAALNTGYLGDSGSSGASIAGTYTTGPGQTFQDVVFEATAGAGCSSFQVSWASTRPWSTTPPTVPGTPQATVPVTAANGAWSGSPAFAYVWRRCAADGSGCATIAGATSQSYTPTGDDVGKTLAVTVTASFTDQTTVLASAPSAVVSAAPPAPATTPTTTTPVVPAIPAPPAITLTGVKQSVTTWRIGKAQAKLSAARKQAVTGTTFSFAVNQAASITLTFATQTTGRKVGSKCVKTTKANTKRSRCALATAAGTVKLAAQQAGAVKVAFQGLLSAKKKLKPGRSTVIISATAGGRTATAKALKFTVVR